MSDFDIIEGYKKQRENAPVNTWAKELAKIYIEKGKEACFKEIHNIGISKKLKDFEVMILKEKIGNILIFNGIKVK